MRCRIGKKAVRRNGGGGHAWRWGGATGRAVARLGMVPEETVPPGRTGEQVAPAGMTMSFIGCKVTVS